ncbi:MAG TPA: rhodanese-like domain-containing protein [Solirubrobacteraceae bacterium]|jgi:thiosulfate/3-mercaptopyruvate sulfurtransferase
MTGHGDCDEQPAHSSVEPGVSAGSDSTAIIDAAWIAEHLGDPGVQLIEVDVSPAAYTTGHIPGAVLWNAYTDLRGPDYKTIALGDLERLLSRSGCTPSSTLVFYGYGAALGFWLMKAHAHHDARLLIGSREQWALAGGEWSTQVPEPPEPTATSSYPLVAPSEDLFASQAAVEGAIGDPNQILLDVRAELEYSGERFWPSGATEDVGRAGHLPGAISVPIDLLRTGEDTLRSPEDLRDAFENAGVSSDKQVIVYCTIGNRASQAWFALKYLLAYPKVSVYYGSWVEWGNATDTPVET